MRIIHVQQSSCAISFRLRWVNYNQEHLVEFGPATILLWQVHCTHWYQNQAAVPQPLPASRCTLKRWSVAIVAVCMVQLPPLSVFQLHFRGLFSIVLKYENCLFLKSVAVTINSLNKKNYKLVRQLHLLHLKSRRHWFILFLHLCFSVC